MSRASVLAALAAIVALMAPLLPWLVGRSGDPEAFGGLCVQLAAVVVGVVVLRRPSPSSPPSSSSPRTLSSRSRWLSSLLPPGRLSLVIGAVLLFAGLAAGVRLVQMAGVLCLAHAVVGVVAPARASDLVPSLWLAVLGLPLTGDLDVIGFPARMFAARVAQASLSLLGLEVGGAETVLVVEGNVADVEAPCAGLQTLRMLAAVVIVVAALRRSGLGPLALALLGSAVVAVVGNALRVTALAALVLGAHREDFARLVHVPLGVLVFGAAVVVADLLLRAGDRGGSLSRGRAPGRAAPSRQRTSDHRHLDIAALLVVASACTLLRLSSPARSATSPASFSSSSSSTSFSQPSADAIPLTDAERSLFGRHALFAEKRALDHGSVLIVVATSLRAHHAPERCLAGSGFRVDSSTSVDVALPDGQRVPVKRLLLDGGARVGLSFYVRDDGGRPHVVASLWERTVDALVHRAPGPLGPWSAAPGPLGPWALVSAVVDAPFAAADDVAALVPLLIASAHARLLPPRPELP